MVNGDEIFPSRLIRPCRVIVNIRRLDFKEDFIVLMESFFSLG